MYREKKSQISSVQSASRFIYLFKSYYIYIFGLKPTFYLWFHFAIFFLYMVIFTIFQFRFISPITSQLKATRSSFFVFILCSAFVYASVCMRVFLFIFLHVLLWYCRHWSKIQFKMIYWNWWWSTKTKENGEETSRETVKTNGNEEIAAEEWQRNSWASDYVCFCVLPDCYFIFSSILLSLALRSYDELRAKSWTSAQ